MQENQSTDNTIDTEAIEIKSLSLVDATIATAKKSFGELVKESSVDKKAKELKAQLKKITIEGIGDKENYNKVKVISRDASKIRIALEKRRKELKADIITAGKNIDALAGEYQALINPVETDADAKLKVIDDALEAEKNRKEREAQERLDNRIAELKEAGITFDGQFYSLQHGDSEISLGVQQIQELGEEDYPKLLEKVKALNEKKIEAQRLAEEAEQARLQEIENQRIANQKLQDELREQKEKLEREKAEMERDRLELEKIKKEQEEAERQRIEYEQEVAIGQKMSRYEDLGMKYSYVNKRLEWSNGSGSQYIDKAVFLNEPDDLYETTKGNIEHYIKEDKILRDTEEKERQEKIKRDAEEAEAKRKSLQNDTERYNEWITALNAIPFPELQDEKLSQYANSIKQLLQTK